MSRIHAIGKFRVRSRVHLSCLSLDRKRLLVVSIYFGRTCTDLVSLSHFPLSAMTAGCSCLERPVSSSSWSTNVVAGRPLERLPSFWSQRRSWEKISFLLLQQWPLNCSRCIWRLVEIGAEGPHRALIVQSVQIAINTLSYYCSFKTKTAKM